MCITIGEDSGGGNLSAVIDVIHISNVETGMRWNQLVQIVGHAVLPQEAGAATFAAQTRVDDDLPLRVDVDRGAARPALRF